MSCLFILTLLSFMKFFISILEYSPNNFFVKKAEIELQETYGKVGDLHE